jgi:membrane-associated phospholipid phosphatase
MLAMTHNGRVVNLNALSAMPSLHVGIAFLNALYFLHKNKAAALAAFAYFLIILIGSVYLGWHYAVDGYAGAACAWAIWALSKPLVRKLHPEWETQK